MLRQCFHWKYQSRVIQRKNKNIDKSFLFGRTVATGRQQQLKVINHPTLRIFLLFVAFIPKSSLLPKKN
jgi:hypothetical protein